VRASLAALALTALTAGCGSTASPSTRGAPKPGSLEALWRNSGESVSLIPGTSDYSPGNLRISFLVVDPRGKVISPPQARVWVGRSLGERPFAKAVARRQPVGVPGVSTDSDVKALFVAHVRVSEPGSYYVVARPVGSVRIAGLREFLVRSNSASPAVGSRAYPSRTPTVASTGGRMSALTTRVPPDRALLRTSIAEALAAHEPFVVTFATPRYCESRTCGPVVDVLDAVRKRNARTQIRFIHVEIYKGNDPRKGPNRWVREWRLPGEPWTFLVGRDGMIKAKFQGSVSVQELQDAIRRFLL
jgi:hypothetical protein